jgi:hypothetical protein
VFTDFSPIWLLPRKYTGDLKAQEGEAQTRWYIGSLMSLVGVSSALALRLCPRKLKPLANAYVHFIADAHGKTAKEQRLS